MGDMHDKLITYGHQGALAFVETDAQRKVLEAAFGYMSDEDSTVGFLFSGWCQTALPHRKLPDDEIWRVKTDHVSLMVEPGSVDAPAGPVRVGVPYGSRARLILLYLQSEAIRTNSPEINLGRSLRVWLGKLGVPIGGKSMRDVREQAMRISRCRMSFEVIQNGKTGFISQNIVDTGIFSSDTASLLETVHLSPRFFAELQRHPVPLQESAIRALSNNSMALDVYFWLAYRLHSLTRECPITWTSLRMQFGMGYKTMKHFKPEFQNSLNLALAVYPDAKVITTDTGVRMLKSPPPVRPKD